MQAFLFLKEKFVSAPIVVALDWNLPFELMCDVSDYAIGPILGQKRERTFQVVYYESQTLNDVQLNYARTEKSFWKLCFCLTIFSRT